MTQRRIYQEEYPYFVTTNVREGMPLFENTKYAKLLSMDILHSCDIKGFDLFSYTIMPDHLHLLVGALHEGSHRTLEKVRWEPMDMSTKFHLQSTLSRVRLNKQITISELMQSIKGNFSRRVHLGNIWQRRFNSRIVDSLLYLEYVVEYIRNNPIKANLPLKYRKFPYQYCNWGLIKSLFY